jgi:hypothetical protein
MPGEERKFRRRRIVAFLPDCRRERERAASQALALDGVSPTGAEVGSIVAMPVGKGVGSTIGVAVGEGSGVARSTSSLVALGAGRDSVGAGSLVRVGVKDGISVAVSERVVLGWMVCAGDGVPVADSVGEGGVEVAVTGFASAVAEEAGRVAWVGSAGVSGGELGLRIRMRKRMRRRTATINLKRS